MQGCFSALSPNLTTQSLNEVSDQIRPSQDELGEVIQQIQAPKLEQQVK